MNFIPALHLYSHKSFFDACPIKVSLEVVECVESCEGTVQGVILPLMRPVELMQCIECRDDGYFTWILPFFFACTSLPPSSIFCLMVYVACLKPFKERSLFRLLKRSTSSASPLGFTSMYQVRTDKRIGPSISSIWAHETLFCVRILPLPHIALKCIFYWLLQQFLLLI